VGSPGLPHLDDVGAEHPAGLGTNVQRVVRGGPGRMRNESPACRVRVGWPWILISTVPARMYPTSSAGWVCQPDSTPAGISVSTCTISRPGIEDGLCWSSVRISVPGSASMGSYEFVMGWTTWSDLQIDRQAPSPPPDLLAPFLPSPKLLHRAASNARPSPCYRRPCHNG
jgi:hypothetical protein